MEADIEKYIKSIEGYSREQHLEECAVLKRQYTNLHVQVIEQRKAETEMSKEYQRISEKVKDQQKQIAELQQKLDCMCAQNDLLLRHRFGSHNEKISALSSEESDLQDPLSEDAVPEDNVVSFEEASRRRQETKNVKRRIKI